MADTSTDATQADATETANKAEPVKDGKPSAIKAISDFFGRMPGQNLKEFAAEVNGLGNAGKEQLREGINNGSLTY